MKVRHLPTRSEGLPSGPDSLQSGPGAAFDTVQFLLRRPGEDAGKDVPDHRLGRVGVGVQVAGPRLLGGGQRPESHLAAAEVPDGVNGVHPVKADPVHRGDHQNVAGDQVGVEQAPTVSGVGACRSGDPHVPVDVVRVHTGPNELQELGFGVAPGLSLDHLPAGADVAI